MEELLTNNYRYQDKKFWLFAGLLSLYPVLLMMDIAAVVPLIIIAAGILFAALFISTTDSINFNKVFSVFLTAFFIRILLATLLGFYSEINDGDVFFLGRDDAMYSVDGLWISELWKYTGVTSKDFILSIYLPSDGTLNYFDMWNGIVYHIIGYSPFSLLYLNCFLGAFTAVLAYLLCRDIFDRRFALALAWTVALWPSLILWSTQNLKETILLFASVGSVWAILKVRSRSFNISSALILAMSLIAFFYLRKVSLLIYIVWIPLWIFFSSSLWRRNKAAWIVFFILLLPVAHRLSDVIHDQLVAMFFNGDRINIYEWIQLNRSNRAYGATAFMSNVDLSSPVAVLKFLPIGMLFCVLAPFPWQLGSFRQMISAPEMLVYYVTFPYLVTGIFYMLKKKYSSSLFLLGIIFFNCVLFSLIDGNVGTMFRHRSIVVPFVLLFLVGGYFHKRGYLKDE